MRPAVASSQSRIGLRGQGIHQSRDPSFRACGHTFDHQVVQPDQNREALA